MELKTQCRERFKPAVDAINEIIKQEGRNSRDLFAGEDAKKNKKIIQ